MIGRGAALPEAVTEHVFRKLGFLVFLAALSCIKMGRREILHEGKKSRSFESAISASK